MPSGDSFREEFGNSPSDVIPMYVISAVLATTGIVLSVLPGALFPFNVIAIGLGVLFYLMSLICSKTAQYKYVVTPDTLTIEPPDGPHKVIARSEIKAINLNRGQIEIILKSGPPVLISYFDDEERFVLLLREGTESQ